jgi:23S rRNA pseudoU1915 N3-methylase RlmH
MQLEELEEEYKTQIRHINTYLQTIYSDKFQKIAMVSVPNTTINKLITPKELQKTEVLRMHKMKMSLKRFVFLLENQPQQTSTDFSNLSDKINSLDTKEEIKNFSGLIKYVVLLYHSYLHLS